IEHVNRDLQLSSPTVRATRLERRFGGPPLWLKNETVLPTATTKDRVAVVVFPFLRQFGIREFVISSTGNTSTSIAWMARHYPDMLVHIFIGREFVERLRHVASANVVVHVVNGSFVAAGKAAQDFAASRA